MRPLDLEFAAAEVLARLRYLPAPSGGDDAVALNAFIAAQPSGSKIVARRGTYNLNTTSLVLRSGHTYDFSQATFTSAQGMGKQLVVNGAQATAVTATDITTTAASAVVTSVTLAATAVAGQQVIVVGAGAGAGAPYAPLIGTVVSKAGNNITLDTAAGQTLANASGSLVTRDSDIVLQGGVFSRTDTGGASGLLTVIDLKHIDGLTIRDLKLTSTNTSGYGIRLGNVSDFTVDRCRISSQSDGVHVQGNCFRGVIRNLKGPSGDNIVALTGRDFTNWEETSGNISDITVEDIFMVGSAPILVLAGDGTTVNRVTVQRVYGTVHAAQPVFQSITYGGYTQTVGGTIDDLVLRDIRAVTSGATMMLQFAATTLGRVTIEDLHVNTAATGHIIDCQATIDHLEIAGFRIVAAGSSSSLCAVIGATVSSLLISRGRAKFTGGSQSLLQVGAAGTVTKAAINSVNIDDTTGAQVVYAPNSTGALGHIAIDNLIADGLGWLADVNTSTDFHLGAIKLTTVRSGAMNLRASAGVTVYNTPACRINSTTLGTTSGYSLRVNGTGFRLDQTKVNAPQDGDLIHNSNASPTNGAGPAVYNTLVAKWKGLFSGVTN